VARVAAKMARDEVARELSQEGRHDLGLMDKQCTHCQAWHWKAEKLAKPRNSLIFGLCCQRGTIVLPSPKCPPRELWELFTGVHALSENFLKNIRAVNAALAFTSFAATRVSEQPAGRGPLIFKIGGEIHHWSGMLDRVPEGQQPQYAQLYLYDPEDAANHRLRNPHNTGIEPALMRLLTGVLQQSHGYAPLYKHAWQMMQAEDQVPTLSIVLRQQRNQDPRRYNLPTSNEIALLIPDGALDNQRDIILFKQDGGFRKIDSWNPAYSCLHYVLLFPRGEHGFQRHIPTQGAQWQRGLHPRGAQRAAQIAEQAENPDDSGTEGEEGDEPIVPNQRQSRRTVSEREYYAYYIFSREEGTAYPGPNGVFSTLFRGRRLFHQYLVDAWAIIDQSKLLWHRNNQAALRVELYTGLSDALLDDNLTCGAQVG
jgi:hypothetical protein